MKEHQAHNHEAGYTNLVCCLSHLAHSNYCLPLLSNRDQIYLDHKAGCQTCNMVYRHLSPP